MGLGVLDHVVQERGGERLLVEMELRADLRRADRMLDEGGAGAALLALVRGCGEPECARHELAIDRAPVLGNRLEQPIEEPLMLLSTLDDCHGFSVLPASGCVPLRKERTGPARSIGVP